MIRAVEVKKVSRIWVGGVPATKALQKPLAVLRMLLALLCEAARSDMADSQVCLVQSCSEDSWIYLVANEGKK